MKTNKIQNFSIKIDDFDDFDNDSIIRNFWMCSVTNRLNEFDFCRAFRQMTPKVEYKLSEHGLLEFEDFARRQDGLYNFSPLENFAIQTNYIYLGIEEIKEAVLKCQYKALKDTFEGMSTFEELQELLTELQNYHGATIEQKTILFDKLIHAQHETGMIFDDVDVDSLRNDIEAEIKEALNL